MIKKLLLRKDNLLSAVSLAAIFLLFTHHLFSEKYSFATHFDNEFFLGPVLAHISNVLRSGEWPLWMETILGGVPIFNLPQLSPFYPFYFSFLPIFQHPLETMRSMHLITLMHSFIFLCNSYILLKVLRVSTISALAGATLVAFNTNSLNYSVWINITAPYAWLPLYLAGFLRLLENPFSLRACIAMLAGITLLALASPAQPLIHAVIVTLVFFLAYAIHLHKANSIRSLKNIMAVTFCITVLALLIVAPVLLPVLGDFKHMIRWIGPFPPVIGNNAIPYEAFLTDQVKVESIPNIFNKLASTQAVGGLFSGVIPIALAIKSFSARKNNWVVTPLLFIGLYSLASSFGDNFGLSHLNYQLPLINKIREPSRFLFLFHLCVGLLAAIGLDQLLREISGEKASLRKYIKNFSGILIFALFNLMLVLYIRLGDGIERPSIKAALFVFAPILLTVSLRQVSSKFSKSIIPIIWFFSIVISQNYLVSWTAPTIAGSQYLTGKTIELVDVLTKVRQLDPQGNYRVIFEDSVDKQSTSMLASYMGIRSFNAYFNPAPYQQFNEIYYHIPRGNYFRSLGAKYLLCRECESKAIENYFLKEKISDISIYEAKFASPHVYIKTSIDGLFTTADDYAERVSKLELDKSILYVTPSSGLQDTMPQKSSSNTCTLETIKKTFNRFFYAVQCDHEGVLVLNEFLNDSWVLKVDGEEKPILKVNGNQLGAHFRTGSHFIQFTYAPPIFKTGIWIFCLGIFLLYFFCQMIRRLGHTERSLATQVTEK